MTQVVLDGGDHGIARIRLSGPETLNALDDGVVAALGDALAEAVADPSARVIVLEGEGRAFSVGGDLGMLGEMKREAGEPGGADAIAGRLRRNAQAVRLLLDSPKPTIAAIDGFCVGAGMAFAAACDIRIGGARAVFDTAYLSVGLSSDFGLPWILSRACGTARAAALLLAPGRLGVEAAREAGLITEVSDDAPARAVEIARRIAGYPPAAVVAMKDNLREAQAASFPDYVAAEARRFADVLPDASVGS